jgi:hypothetical protein
MGQCYLADMAFTWPQLQGLLLLLVLAGAHQHL